MHVITRKRLNEFAHKYTDTKSSLARWHAIMRKGWCEQAADEQAAELDRLEEPGANYRTVDLRSRGISEAQARDLRARLKTFAEDWDRPEAAVYDEDPAR